ncbi:DeoR family transcriptional regulator [Persicimonas caeni]|uniref:DeoR family transcriptional regulator n=1 Tax=Persicimonas caeni TaxID=2292766 RepID=A0A4Y6PPM8_PERCE|nr:DeoR family transcriptional regulator [Persicimonas caeni]QDG50311.1 DeoR family transcriptional regulator [Persicimonas caeni]QED31532.1 DeoR family transcriptional regulator [Persicimonas caeni]
MKKSLLSEAKAALIDMMKVEGEISVDDAVDELDLAKTTIRQHLQLLEQYGLVKRRQQRQGRGRPRIMYSLTEEAREFYPSLEGELLHELVEYLIQQGHLGLVDDFFRQRWRQDSERVMAQADAAGGNWQARMDALGAFLSDRGFLPEMDGETNGTQVKVCNCPYRSAVAATRLPCRLEIQLLEKLSGRKVERTEYILDGDPCCVYQFGKELAAET